MIVEKNGRNLDPTHFQTGREVVLKLQASGFITYFAGGWVRDFLMNCPSDDIDIATSASVEDIQILFEKTIPVGINFGIIIVVENGHSFEVATFRKDRGYLDGRRPDGIELATPKEDALRRDFTINGMFYDPASNELHDYIGGREDLKKGIIRAIGDPHKRFLEDRLRMIRAVRYSSRFHFPIETETLEAIRAHADILFPAVAIERVWQEFVKMATASHFDLALLALHRLDLLPVIFPPLKGTPIEEMQHRLRHLPQMPPDIPVIGKILLLFPSSRLEDKLSLCDYLKLPNKDREFVLFSHELENTLAQLERTEQKFENYEWAKLYANPHFSISLSYLASEIPKEERQTFLKEHNKRQKQLEKAIERLKNRDPIIKSTHLIKEGITPGVHMGILINEAEKLSINTGIEDTKKLIEVLKNTPHWP